MTTDALIIKGDCLNVMAGLPDGSVHCCVTSPPYWGLRDYGVDGQLGLEKTPGEYVARMVKVFREVRRVLKADGTLWLNLGDSYANGGPSGPQGASGDRASRAFTAERLGAGCLSHGLKPKDLVGIPWRVAFALQADGWWLRQDIIWHKPNPMPESVTDRCTKAHEYVFLLTKSERYFYNADAVREPNSPTSGKWGKSVPSKTGQAQGNGRHGKSSFLSSEISHEETIDKYYINGRNRRSVWTVTTKPYRGAHFAVMPPDLVEPCILAGCPENGVVFDPFTGSGTVGAVAIKHGRNFIGSELNPAYVQLARERIDHERNKTPLFSDVI